MLNERLEDRDDIAWVFPTHIATDAGIFLLESALQLGATESGGCVGGSLRISFAANVRCQRVRTTSIKL